MPLIFDLDSETVILNNTGDWKTERGRLIEWANAAYQASRVTMAKAFNIKGFDSSLVVLVGTKAIVVSRIYRLGGQKPKDVRDQKETKKRQHS
jgi:hypothetical protein